MMGAIVGMITIMIMIVILRQKQRLMMDLISSEIILPDTDEDLMVLIDLDSFITNPILSTLMWLLMMMMRMKKISWIPMWMHMPLIITIWASFRRMRMTLAMAMIRLGEVVVIILMDIVIIM